jgi:hypothetical protein
VLYEVFLKLRKCSQPYDKHGKKKRLVCLADPVIIRREAGNPVGQWSVSYLYNKAVKPNLLQRRYDHFYKKILLLIQLPI